MGLIGKLLRFFSEWSGRNLTWEAIGQKLEQSGKKVARRMQAADDTPGNREVAAHVIGIERWGQRRLQVTLGEPLILDEYDGYRPDTGESMAALSDRFQVARSGTIALAARLQQDDVPTTRTVPHNDMGEVTLRGWFAYLDGHAARESLRIR
jgi:hypothetical protein